MRNRHWRIPEKLVPVCGAGFVEQIADCNHTRHSSAEEDQLSGGSALAERPRQGVQFLASTAQVAMGNDKVHGLERSMAGKERLVRNVPKVVLGWNRR